MAQDQVGRWAGNRHSRYWEGSCTCGSGKPGRELYDARGIYAGITCVACKKEDTLRPEVMTNPNYEADEPIEED